MHAIRIPNNRISIQGILAVRPNCPNKKKKKHLLCPSHVIMKLKRGAKQHRSVGLQAWCLFLVEQVLDLSHCLSPQTLLLYEGVACVSKFPDQGQEDHRYALWITGAT